MNLGDVLQARTLVYTCQLVRTMFTPHSHAPEHSVHPQGWCSCHSVHRPIPTAPGAPAQPGCSPRALQCCPSRRRGSRHAPTLPPLMFLFFSVAFVSPWGQRIGSQDTTGPTPPEVPWRQKGFKSHPQGNKWVAQDLASGLAPGMPHPMHTPENTKGACSYRHSVLQMPLGKLVGSRRKLESHPLGVLPGGVGT